MSVSRNVKFGVLDRDAEVNIRRRDLPHWFQPGVAIFITFRTYDSMPRQVIEQWQNQIKMWLKENGHEVASNTGPLPDPAKLPSNLQAEFRRVKDKSWQERLDQCHGECVLRDPAIGQIVVDALRYFDGERYDLASLVVMPNHIHLIAQFYAGFGIQKQSESWLRYTATRINRRLGRKGAFWQPEPFDHLVRSEAQFWYLVKYIRDNPSKAGLGANDAIHFDIF